MSLMVLLIAFGGGVFGAVFGGTIAIIFSGLLTVIGLSQMTANTPFFINEIAFGPFFGPQSAFVGGVAAAAWIGKCSDDPTVGSDVMNPLFNKRNITSYLIGGTFGMFGHLLSAILHQLSPPIDVIALTIVIFNVLVRLLIARTPIYSNHPTGIPWYTGLKEELKYNMVWGFILGLAVAYICIQMGSPMFGWGISIITLIFQYTNIRGVPVTHHITMIAGYAALATGNIFIAAVLGILAMVIGHIIERLNNINVASHIDMPATVIALLSLPIFAYEQFIK